MENCMISYSACSIPAVVNRDNNDMQVGFAFRHIEGALNYLVNNLDKFSGLAAETERLDALLTGPTSGPLETPGEPSC